MPNNLTAGVLCAGVTCMDLFLLNTFPLKTPESRSDVESVEFVPGGSTSNTARAVAQLGVKNEILTLIGNDPHGDMLLLEYARMGIGTNFVQRTDQQKTALSTLPVYKGTGKRAIYFCMGTNSIMTSDHILLDDNVPKFSVFHYGYPHLSPLLQGENLKKLFQSANSNGDIITSLDINGADSQHGIIEPCLPLVDFLHSNIEEALAICGELDNVLQHIDRQHNHMFIIENEVNQTQVELCAKYFLDRGCGIVAITLGHRGCYVKISDDIVKINRLNRLFGGKLSGLNPGVAIFANAFKLISNSSEKSITNTTGAGDSFVGGFLSCFATFFDTNTTMSLLEVIKIAQMAAVYRLSGNDTRLTVEGLLKDINNGKYQEA